MRQILPSLLALSLLLSVNADPASRHAPPSVPGWLNIHGHSLLTPEFYGPAPHELAPLREMIGGAQVVGLGDGTHGTHEFFTVKLRIIDFLVREMDFDTIVLEGPVPQFADLNAYVLGADVDPRAVLQEVGGPTLGYVFWECEEILAVLDWMREYNQTRGTRPPVQIFGSDNFGQNYAYHDVIDYLDGVDPGLAATARAEYACIGASHFTTSCGAQATRVRDALLATEAGLIARSSFYDYSIALYNAMTVLNAQSGIFARDRVMAENVTWLRDRMSTTGRAVFWGHNAHMSRREMDLSVGVPTGEYLAGAYGEDYYAIGTMTGGGSFQTWVSRRGRLVRQVATFQPFGPNSHEASLSRRNALSFILPLRGELPEWLTADLEMNAANASGPGDGSTEVLPTAFDAVVYIPETTPLRMLRP
ncbi:MAG TPA: erythromycin esterase family protein [Thermoanaerobaculia bacterium]|jgi:erythromycin esterase